MIINDEQLYTMQDVADISGLSIKTIRRRMDAGKIKRLTAPNEKVKFWGKEVKRWLGIIK